MWSAVGEKRLSLGVSHAGPFFRPLQLIAAHYITRSKLVEKLIYTLLVYFFKNFILVNPSEVISADAVSRNDR